MKLGALKKKNLHRWLGGYAGHLARRARAPRVRGPRHVLFALCDHYEPEWGGASTAVAEARVRRWSEGYPKLVNGFRDADGRPPRHSFFFPGEQYTRSALDRLAQLARAGFGEVELHLHHDQDTRERLEHSLREYLAAYATHGHFSRGPNGEPRYAFIHGNWCLANSRRDGRWCGVDAELPLLFETGCYADFTFPSAPDETQPGIVNQIYWPAGDLSRSRAHEQGTASRVGEAFDDRILMIQGPLALAARPKPLGLRIEGSALTAADPGTPRRIRSWVDQGIHVRGRPEWVFVKVHTHGAPEAQAEALLGDAGRAMHHELCSRYNDGERFVLHYVTAREMFNIARAAMAGLSGNPHAYRDYLLAPPPVLS
jgi:hypothetical protein